MLANCWRDIASDISIQNTKQSKFLGTAYNYLDLGLHSI